ncbi:hypothetical protein UY3_14323 [Chelonia mydas]|uniref:Uncharacterized protein n=1 Tax=Chelonia mydas TaxID=8469 RepID=M7AT84_CHEMY|nr:hypothetical protein UY3_14323 [Chelonia mydas]
MQCPWAVYRARYTRPSTPDQREIRSPPSPNRETSETQGDKGDEEEEGLEHADTSLDHSSSSSPDKAVIPLSPSTVDDLKQFQELLKEVQENQHKLLHILQTSTTFKISLPINDALMEPAENIWKTPTIYQQMS